eukprot:3665198-Rhodomonas_salina.2
MQIAMTPRILSARSPFPGTSMLDSLVPWVPGYAYPGTCTPKIRSCDHDAIDGTGSTRAPEHPGYPGYPRHGTGYPGYPPAVRLRRGTCPYRGYPPLEL